MYYETLSSRMLAASLLAMISTGSPFALAATPDRFLNPGFEQPLNADGTIPGWQTSAVELAIITDGDDGSDYPVYTELGLTIPPLLGSQSLLLGKPDVANGQQIKGSNAATANPFITESGEVRLTIRIFSFEPKGNDRIVFNVFDDGYRCYDESCDSSYYTSSEADLSAVSYAFTQVEAPPGSRPLDQVTELCSAGAECSMAIDIGQNNGPIFDSGIYEVTISGIPVDVPVQFSAGVITGSSSSKATWMYLDDAVVPLEPALRVNPGDTPEFPALEGDFVVADCLESSGTDLQCEWEAIGGGWDTPRTASGDIAFFWFPDDEPVTINLTVTSSDGQVATLSKSLHIINAQPAVNAINVEVLAGSIGETICRFLDAGIGRYDDNGLIPGMEEQHYLVGGIELEAQQESEASFSSGFFRIPAEPGSGICEVLDEDGDSGSDTFVVNEISAADLPTRLGDETRSGGTGGNDTIETAYPLEVDWKHLGAISDPQDIDVFRVVRDGTSLPAGTELVITLEGQPADYDLLVFSNGGSTEASPFFNAPFFNAPFFNAPFFNAPFFNAPFFNAQFNSVPFFNAPFFNAPFFNAPFFNAPVKKSPFFNAGEGFNRAFDELPLSQVGLAAPDGSNVSGSDIGVAEIGSLSLKSLQSSPGISLKALSAEPGLGSEKVLVTIGPGETEIYVAVAGNDLAFSATQPYSLTLEASSPPPQSEVLAGTGFCDGERADEAIPVDELNDATYLYGPSWSAAATGNPGAGNVLILTQRERFELEQAGIAAAAVAAGEFPDPGTYWANFWNKVGEYASAVGGTLVSVDGSLFEAADRSPCSVATRNALMETIRDTYIIDQASTSWRNPSLESVVIIGGQNIIPPLAVKDEAIVGNERDFTTDLWVRPGTPLAVSTAEGFNLTDAAYADLIRTPFRGRWLYLEDRPVARLVEKPAEIMGDIDAYFAYLGGSAPNSGRIAYGYDFFCDGTANVAELLGVEPRNGPPCDPFDSAWTAGDLTADWLRGGASMCTDPTAATALEIANVNAHMTTYGALSAAGFLSGEATGVYDDTIEVSEAQQCLDGTLTLTIGCHSGLNIPDAWALTDELNLPFDPALDWVEVLGFMVAPRGYGLGDNTVANRGTEGIMTLVVEELSRGTALGQALVNAKRRYVMGLRELDVHDEDSLINLSLFAPPQLTFAFTTAQQQAISYSQASTSGNATAGYAGMFELIVREGLLDGTESYLVGSAAGPEVYDLIRYDDLGLRGSWFEVSPGDGQATYGRSLLPVTLPVEDRVVTSGDTRIHGVALVSRALPLSPCPIDGRPSCSIAASYTDLDDVDTDGLFDFNPVFPLPQHDWVVYEDDLNIESLQEPQSCVKALAPTQLGVASTLDNGEQVSQSLIIGAGQFRCEPEETRLDAPDQVVGQQRLFSRLEMAALHPVGNSVSEAQARDADFDSPQVLVQSVLADPQTGTVTATVQATDALTGGSGIREIIALVYWDEDDNDSGTGVIESYSITPDDGLTAEPFGHTFVLENARDQRVAFQYIDGAGNLTVKSQKGTLIRAVDVEILDTEVDLIGSSSISIFVGTFCALQSPTVSYSINGGGATSFTLDNPPAGVTVTITESTNPDNPNGPCDATILIEGIDFALTEYGQSAELTVEIRALGAAGSDTEVVSTPPVLEITLPLLPSGTQGIDYPDQTLTATGGVGGYLWSITQGSLPPGLTLDGNSGLISGSPTSFVGSPFSFHVTVTDSGNISTSVQASIHIAPPPLVIEEQMLPAGRVGDAYIATLSATGGSGVAQWTVTAGGLPEGITLSLSGELSGIPSAFAASPYVFTATLTDADADVVASSIELSIDVSPPPLVIPGVTLPGGRVGDVYFAILTATGGSGNAEWSISDGSLPDGLTLTPTGEITGTPVEFGASPYLFTATLSDADEDVSAASVTLSIEVVPPPLVVTPISLPAGRVGDAYPAQTLSVTGGSGSVQWAITTGGLPPGLILAANGQISGTPGEFKNSPYAFTASATDAAESVVPASIALSIAIAPPLAVINPITLPTGTVGVAYPDQTLTASGGTGSGSWSVSSGALPDGLSLSSSGRIGGTPTSFAGSPFTFSVTYTDSNPQVAPVTTELGIGVQPAPLVVETTSLPDGTKYEYYSEALSASGGRGNNQWSLSSGQLPRGLSLSSSGVISGTAERRETDAFTVTVSDGQQQTSSSFTITINTRSCDDKDDNHDHPKDCNDE